jgi:hypothetical protein
MIEKQAVRIHNVVMLISIFVGVALLILTQSYFFGAFILPDSGYYLRLAEALRNGSRSYVDMISGSWEKQNYFAVWPIGYPVMIAFIALITNTEIYLASKIVSVIILLILFALFYIRFKNHAWLYALITINYGFLHFFYVTCSEQPFILGLIWLSFTLVDILKSEKVKYVHYISLGFASLFLFLSRYIGVFSVGAIGLTAVYQVYACISERRGGGGVL